LPAVSLPIGVNPSSLAIADLDGDQLPDIVSGNFASSDLSVLLGRGDGSFGPATSFPAGGGAISLAVADLDLDGVLDLATVNEGSNEVGVLLGNGDGSFRAAARFGVGDSPVRVTAADLDGDGFPDLVTANRSGDDLTVLLNRLEPNAPPVADAGPDQIVECTSPAGAEVRLEGDGSSDPDGDPLAFRWSGPFGTATVSAPAVTLALGSHEILLVVEDPLGAIDSDTSEVTVEDTTLPVVEVSIEWTLGKRDDKRVRGRRLQVAFSCRDLCDPHPTSEATLNGLPVQDGDVVGVDPHHNPSSATLQVTCEDASGNQVTATAWPPRNRGKQREPCRRRAPPGPGRAAEAPGAKHRSPQAQVQLEALAARFASRSSPACPRPRD
jgi:hypothetical protein